MSIFKKIFRTEQTRDSKPLGPGAIKIVQQPIYRQRQDIKNWRDALARAEHVERPRRADLIKIYQDITLDAHLTALMQSRRLMLLSKKHRLHTPNGEPIYVLEHSWFRRFLEHTIDSIFYGYSLVYLGAPVGPAFPNMQLVPRSHVVPEHSMVLNQLYDDTGTCYTEEPYSQWYIGMGKADDLGLLLKAAPLVLWKKNAFGSWSEYAEIFGMPFRIGKTNVRDEELRRNMEDMLKNMGSACYAVFDESDTIDFVQATGTVGNQVYESMIAVCDAQLSKLIMGQTLTTDSGGSYAQAQVHRTVADDYLNADLLFVEQTINTSLLPVLQFHGIIPEGCRFGFIASDDYEKNMLLERDLKLMQYYRLPAEYIRTTYNIPVEDA